MSQMREDVREGYGRGTRHLLVSGMSEKMKPHPHTDTSSSSEPLFI